MTRTLISAALFALIASTACAQTDAGKPGALSLDPGSSGGNAGLISGGGSVSSNFDGRDARPSIGTRTQPAPAKTDAADGKDDRVATKASAKAARARAEGNDEASSGKKKARKQEPSQRYYGYPYVYPHGFTTFGRSYSRQRD